MDKIIDLEVKYLVFKCQKEIKEITLCKRRLEFEAEDKLDRENMEREARQQGQQLLPQHCSRKRKAKL